MEERFQNSIPTKILATYRKKPRNLVDAGKSSSVIADNYGEWVLKLATPSAGGPYEVLVNDSKNSIIGSSSKKINEGEHRPRRK